VSLDRIRLDQERVRSEVNDLHAQIHELTSKLADAEARLARLNSAVEVLAEYETTERTASPTQLVAIDQAVAADTPRLMDERSPLYGKSLPEAAVHILKVEDQPLAASAIGVRLRESGWPFSSPNPETTIYWALRHRSMREKDVVSVPGSKWGMREWGLETPVSARTKAGLVAAVARGQKLGPRHKMTPELAERLKQFLDNGMSISKAATALGVSKPTVYRFMHRSTETHKPDLVTLARKMVADQIN